LFIEVDTTNVSTSQSGCIDYWCRNYSYINLAERMHCLLKWKLQLHQPRRVDAFLIEVETTSVTTSQNGYIVY
jgi:hypothetical protein